MRSQGLRGAGAQLLCGGESGDTGFRHAPTLLTVRAEQFLADPPRFQAEAFGPCSLLVRTADTAQMQAIAATLEGQLTATLYRAADGRDDAAWAPLAAALRPRVGRLIADRMPTGVLVSPAQQHGGPFPASTQPGFTAVGLPAAILRFTALQAYDNVPDALLPPELRDRNPGGLLRCIDRQWTTADIGAGA